MIDIGCGTCSKLDTLVAPFCESITAIDVFDGKTILRCKSEKIEYLCIDFENQRLNRKYDVVICVDVIEHIIDPDKLINFIIDVSHNDSYIVLSTPERDILRGKNCIRSDKPDHIREWNKKEFFEYITHSGFIVIEHFEVPAMKLTMGAKSENTSQILLCKKDSILRS